jgi:hypothetical protein
MNIKDIKDGDDITVQVRGIVTDSGRGRGWFSLNGKSILYPEDVTLIQKHISYQLGKAELTVSQMKELPLGTIITFGGRPYQAVLSDLDRLRGSIAWKNLNNPAVVHSSDAFYARGQSHMFETADIIYLPEEV